MDTLENLRYPIGRYSPPDIIQSDTVSGWITEISDLPALVKVAVEGLSEEQLLLTYREGGWNIQQIIYHLGDSHLNSYVRFKWTLTEETPQIKTYDEAAWASLHDSNGSLEDALDFLRVLHTRWAFLMSGMSDSQWEKEFTHPETGRAISLKKNLGLYVWHGQHHLAHIHLALN